MGDLALRNIIKSLILELRNQDQPDIDTEESNFKVSVDKDYPGSHTPMTGAGITEYESNVDFVFSNNATYVCNTKYYVKRDKNDSRKTAGKYHGGYSHAIRHGPEIDKQSYDSFLKKVEKGCISRFKNGNAHLCQHRYGLGAGELVAIYSTNSSFLDKVDNMTGKRVETFEIEVGDVDSFLSNGPNDAMSNRISSLQNNRSRVKSPVYNLGAIANTLDRANDIHMGNDEGSFENESALLAFWDQFTGKKGFFKKFAKEIKSLGEDVSFVTNEVFKQSILNKIKETIRDNKIPVNSITSLGVKINLQENEIDGFVNKIDNYKLSEDNAASISLPSTCTSFETESDTFIIGSERDLMSLSRQIREINKIKAVARIIDEVIPPAVNSVLEDYKSKNKKIAYVGKGNGHLMPIFDLVKGRFMILTNSSNKSQGWTPLTFLASKSGGKIGNPASPQKMIEDLSEAEVWAASEEYSVFLCYIRKVLPDGSKFKTSITNRPEIDFANYILNERDQEFKRAFLTMFESLSISSEEIQLILESDVIKGIIVKEPDNQESREEDLENQSLESSEEIEQQQVQLPSVETEPATAPPQKRKRSRLRAHLAKKRGL